MMIKLRGWECWVLGPFAPFHLPGVVHLVSGINKHPSFTLAAIKSDDCSDETTGPSIESFLEFAPGAWNHLLAKLFVWVPHMWLVGLLKHSLLILHLTQVSSSFQFTQMTHSLESRLFSLPICYQVHR